MLHPFLPSCLCVPNSMAHFTVSPAEHTPHRYTRQLPWHCIPPIQCNHTYTALYGDMKMKGNVHSCLIPALFPLHPGWGQSRLEAQHSPNQGRNSPEWWVAGLKWSGKVRASQGSPGPVWSHWCVERCLWMLRSLKSQASRNWRWACMLKPCKLQSNTSFYSW